LKAGLTTLLCKKDKLFSRIPRKLKHDGLFHCTITKNREICYNLRTVVAKKETSFVNDGDDGDDDDDDDIKGNVKVKDVRMVGISGLG
jgi:hypothetical protein